MARQMNTGPTRHLRALLAALFLLISERLSVTRADVVLTPAMQTFGNALKAFPLRAQSVSLAR